MSTQTAFSGLAHNDAGDFLKRVKEALEQLPPAKEPEAKPAESAKPKPAAEPAPQPTAQPAAPAAAEPENYATVNVKSTPDGGDISVDGKFAGNTPSALRLPAGEHTILIEKSGMKPWQRTMTVSPGGNVTIDAKLEQAQ